MKSEANHQVNHESAVVPKSHAGSGKMVFQVMQNYQVTLLLFIVMFILTAILAPEFYNLQNMINVARQASITGVVAVGMTFVILTGGIDLSVGAILAVVGVTFATMIKQGIPVTGAILIALIIGVCGGLINGIGATFLGIQPFIMTLATMAAGNGVALLLTKGTPIDFKANSAMIELLGNGKIAGIPGPVLLFILSAVLAGIVLRYLPFGRFVYGIGGSLEAARLSGVRTTRILLAVYAVSGLSAALAGLMTTARLYVGHPTAGSFIMLDSIAAVVIGGTSLMGGRGSVAGTVAGVLLLAMVANLLNLLGVSPFNQQIAKGVIIVVAVLFTTQGLKQRIKQQWSGL
ncbi:ABC transporter permease [Paenibacillus validus]|uniref:Ribose ABC transporter permease n=1 Tax=Paenibacillus validus TaxID=44253 RepID=A0A7X3CS73_9BACL|nr:MULTISPECIES: ABC transporter permease [Paenibacillus]MED4600517.1 ABC transporter permease [Paenibacillus validus]MED4604776.1 ABC transporter permease [Paenibacillus validus]MUG71002.1 ribose ABC transporter permease [Paenibacillus validus]